MPLMLVVLHRLSQGSAGNPLSLLLMMHQGCYGLDCVLAIDGVLHRYVGEALEVHPKMHKLSDELKSPCRNRPNTFFTFLS